PWAPSSAPSVPWTPPSVSPPAKFHTRRFRQSSFTDYQPLTAKPVPHMPPCTHTHATLHTPKCTHRHTHTHTHIPFRFHHPLSYSLVLSQSMPKFYVSMSSLINTPT